MTDRELLELAKEAQKATIKGWLKINYAGGHKAVGKWNDHYFFLSDFMASCMSRVEFGDTSKPHTDKARRQLDRMAKDEVLERIKKTYGPVSYRFPREICNTLAAEATNELLAEGLEMDRIFETGRNMP